MGRWQTWYLRGAAPLRAARMGDYMRGRSLLWICGIAGFISAIDLWSKNWAVASLQDRCMSWPPFVLELQECGMPFTASIGDSWVFTWVGAIVSVAILWVSAQVTERWWRVGLGVLLGGVIGDLLDRLFRSPGFGSGKAVRFMASEYFPTLNLAYCAVLLGCIHVGALLALGINTRNPDDRLEDQSPNS